MSHVFPRHRPHARDRGRPCRNLRGRLQPVRRQNSSAAALAVIAHLDRIGHPKAHRHAIHADLGQIEWRSTAGFVEAIAEKLETPLTVVRRNAGGLIQRWQQRWQSSRDRYAAMETYQLISPFSSAKLRFCTSETKVAPIGSHFAQRLQRPDHHIGRRHPPRGKPGPRRSTDREGRPSVRSARKQGRHTNAHLASAGRLDNAGRVRSSPDNRFPAARSLYALRCDAPQLFLLRAGQPP